MSEPKPIVNHIIISRYGEGNYVFGYGSSNDELTDADEEKEKEEKMYQIKQSNMLNMSTS